ncbi:Daunorubicin/doxorubicin resistance ATP-binding protein DrrA [Geobacillus sp. TFV-3]|nr:Daunorubicin/doxorubicin resistance ATP-binding protein DrrA [Geobacillus sp. TFV-3]
MGAKHQIAPDHQEWAVEAHGLVKTFGGHRAVDGLNLRVRAGTIYGVLGPNGAGKTTTIRMLATLLRPDAGSAKIFGYDNPIRTDPPFLLHRRTTFSSR